MSLSDHMTERGISDTDVATAVGVTTEAVRLWRKGHRKVAPDTARKIEKLFGIPKHELRPDLWSPAEAA